MDCFEDPFTDDESMEPMDSESFDDESMEIKESSKTYKALTKDDIKKNQEDDVALLSTALSVPTSAAAILLQNYKWNVESAQDAWFNDEDGVRESVGLLKKPVVGSRKSGDLLVCGICFENYVYNVRFESTVGFCGHSFCRACLKTYVIVAINDGSRCLFLRCPDPSCHAVIGEDMVNVLVCRENMNKYKEFYYRSYVELSKARKWCPARDCGGAIEYELGSENSGVTCECSFSFCWHCAEDYHSPVACETVKTWILKNTSESENVTWVLANTKPCPKCEVPIEKNSGCMHMTCKRPCHHEFCWICLGPWLAHDSKTCNGYKETVRRGESEVHKRRQGAQEYIQRYAHYYERWAANDKSRKKALADLHEIKNEKLEKLEKKHHQPAGQLTFVTEAWDQIVECRRVLKWTYVYGYYMPPEAYAKTELFEYLQGEAEVALERLHDCAENKLQKYFEDDANSDEFNKVFRKELTNLTRVTGRYFSNFLKGLENGLSEVDNPPSKVKHVQLKDAWKCQSCGHPNDGEHNMCYMCLNPCHLKR
ncbi:RBR-type E3 ubiquitin transferase [Heracleum sosnowskyi]|uniref:RanBP-type and C3HC4-type zinc finger-containing protein 1 n=1 Tax=Heracleum sosnowskyi TaxID=360622 RepID=A0AAD8GUT0_9APIA|nr:RBR-type E3 ubiquitin transferase [Heracleum sosnowskyi]